MVNTDACIKLMFPYRAADMAYVKLFIDLHDRLGSEPSLEMLVVLRTLRDTGEVTLAELNRLAQRPTEEALAALKDAGVAAVKGEHFLLIGVPGEDGKPPIDSLEVQQQILDYVEAHGKITRREAMEQSPLNENQAKRQLQDLVKQKKLYMHGTRKTAVYTREP